MLYRSMPLEKIQEYPYPNLIAEYFESGYSLCTLAKHMGIGGGYDEAYEQEAMDRLTGKKEILASEAIGLSRLFGADVRYLFSHELKMLGGQTYAYHRWYESNRKRDQERRQYKQRERLVSFLRENPEYGDIFEALAKMDLGQAQRLIYECGCETGTKRKAIDRETQP